MEIKDIIKNKRIELGFNMKELANKVGVSEATISRWESGDIANMRRDKVAALSQILDISPQILMGWDLPEKDTSLTSKAQQVALAFDLANDSIQTAVCKLLDIDRGMEDYKDEVG